MSYWSHNVEELDRITIEALPEPWKSRCENGDIYVDDVPQSIRLNAMDIGIKNYWSDRIDEADMRRKEI